MRRPPTILGTVVSINNRASVLAMPGVKKMLVLNASNHGDTMDDVLSSFQAKALHGVVLFDVYRGAGLPENTKSLAIGLILHDFSRTLNESEVEKSIAGVLTALANECQAVLRT